MDKKMDKQCPHCDHIFSFDFTICPNCGKKYRKCPHCGHTPLPDDKKICPACGKKYR
jgi:RNA polymerase subunit RPABC4/transcription elongation factor Spt4